MKVTLNNLFCGEVRIEKLEIEAPSNELKNAFEILEIMGRNRIDNNNGIAELKKETVCEKE